MSWWIRTYDGESLEILSKSHIDRVYIVIERASSRGWITRKITMSDVVTEYYSPNSVFST